jgi:mannobiose 2-epimerase
MHQEITLNTTQKQKLLSLLTDVQGELKEILFYWLQNMIDEANGGFYGQRLYDETLVPDSPKGVVLNARILWSFSTAALLTKNEDYSKAAGRAFDYLSAHFYDKEFGGVYWSLDFEGNPLDTKKQVYALSFAIYGLTEYYRLTANEEAKRLSLELFDTVEKYSRDKLLGGYIEAFTRDWQPIDDLRLSDKDANEKKTMNTHLHVLEAYTNLYRIEPTQKVKEAVTHLLEVFKKHIIDASNHHLVLFLDDAWNRKGRQISYGHDIEASWLLYEAAAIIGDEKWMDVMHQAAVKIADAASEGIDERDGGMWHEFDPATMHLTKEKHWWPQSEAMVGYLNAYQLSGNEKYLEKLIDSWFFIKAHIKDEANGEWIWGVNEDYSLMSQEDKAGFWKCPYHNSRACIELMLRIGKMLG